MFVGWLNELVDDAQFNSGRSSSPPPGMLLIVTCANFVLFSAVSQGLEEG